MCQRRRRCALQHVLAVSSFMVSPSMGMAASVRHVGSMPAQPAPARTARTPSGPPRPGVDASWVAQRMLLRVSLIARAMVKRAPLHLGRCRIDMLTCTGVWGQLQKAGSTPGHHVHMHTGVSTCHCTPTNAAADWCWLTECLEEEAECTPSFGERAVSAAGAQAGVGSECCAGLTCNTDSETCSEPEGASPLQMACQSCAVCVKSICWAC